MSELKGAMIIGQSGGPSSVINASCYGAIKAGLDAECITKVYGAANGIVGVLNDKLYIMDEEDPEELAIMKYTPSSALGSCRYKIADPDVDDTDYKRILEIFKKYDVRYFFYNGGNDSMDTCNKISKYMKKVGYDCRVMGIPKTIDNDLYGTDHCPGFASAAKYIATSIVEIYQDAHVYDKGIVTIVEVMGRNAGWLAAAASLAKVAGYPADLIYLPEVDFKMDEFLEDVKKTWDKNQNVIVVVSEGIHYADGQFVATAEVSAIDGFGHAQLGGLAAKLGGAVKSVIPDVKVRPVEISLLQRCAEHCASQTDSDEAFMAGQTAVSEAIKGVTDKMVGFKCTRDENAYNCEPTLLDLASVANFEKKVPVEWINERGNGVKDDFIEYALPLIQGEIKMRKENSLPRFVRLKKVVAE